MSAGKAAEPVPRIIIRKRLIILNHYPSIIRTKTSVCLQLRRISLTILRRNGYILGSMIIIDTDDLKCINETLQGRTRPFNDIIVKYQDRIYTLVVRSIGSREDAKDITQNVFINAFSSLRRFRRECSFQSWLYRIAINQVKNYWRNKKNRFIFPESELTPPASDNEDRISEIAEAPKEDNAEETRRQVNDLISSLPLEQRQIFLFFYVIGHTCQEIADILNTTPSNVKIQLYRGRQHLYEKYKKRHYLP
jgi:RNA polymerase sigma-70 factor, ECF subfamily